MKLLKVILTDDRFIDFLPRVILSVKELITPKIFIVVDILIMTDDKQIKIIEYCKNNKLSYEVYKNDLLKTEKKSFFDTKRLNASGWTVKKMSKVMNIRNAYLDYASNNDYNYLLQIDGDVLPEKNGLSDLYNTGKKYVGASVSKTLGGKNFYYVIPDKVSEGKLYECFVIGNCFHLEHSDLFSFKYELPNCDETEENLYKLDPDSFQRCLEYRKFGGKIYCNPLVKCNHLEL